MADTDRDDFEMRIKAEQNMMSTKDPLERIRLSCLSRGCGGIKGFGRQFRIMDDDRSKTLNFEEFLEGIHDYGLKCNRDDGKELFDRFDKDKSGSISFDEFIVALRPPMSEARMNKIKAVFQKLDRTGDGVCTVADIKGVYNVRYHPKYQNGEWTEKEILQNFLKSFDSKNDPDEKVTLDEFIDYYSGVSASIDDDNYFALVMNNAWKL
ncbi:calcyphosin-like protein [Anneissia japonica]|uniref:calcyphosin-like protein n=1 Tax=Anneissia japonica TaxID=1529436 RepID=UPI0014254DF8|nr:calcyphosin-like protein [Anneissia japonica]XP_033102394.1 calcyphosin-like protein [Anneissia japonica]XP_033102401.1 calcyphosin-like protein [Anneissia japonica]